MGHQRLYAAILAFAWAGHQGPEVHRFGQQVRLKPGASLTVTRRGIDEFRRRYPSEFADSAENLVAFEFAIRSADEAQLVIFKTDRENPARSDVVVLCDSARVNILKMGGAAIDDPTAYTFGPPGAYQARTDGLWRSMTVGTKSFVAFFALPQTCTSARQQLLVGLTVPIEGRDSILQLQFAEPRRRAP